MHMVSNKYTPPKYCCRDTPSICRVLSNSFINGPSFFANPFFSSSLMLAISFSCNCHLILISTSICYIAVILTSLSTAPSALQLAAASCVLPHWTRQLATPYMLLAALWFLWNAWLLQVLLWQFGVSAAVHYMEELIPW